MDEREAKARGLIDTLELPERTLEVDHWLVVPVLAERRGGLKTNEHTYTSGQGAGFFKIFASWDVALERLGAQAIRETLAKLRQADRQEREQQEEAGNPL